MINSPSRPRRGALALALVLAAAAASAQTVTAPSTAAQAAANAAAAGPLLSIADLVAQVQQHNPGLRASVLGRSAAQAAVIGASALPNPELELGGGSLRPRTPAAVGGSSSSWSVAQLLENPALRGARIDAAQSGLEGSRWQVSNAANELVAQVRLRAYELLLRREEADAAADALALLEQIRDRVRTRVASGEAPRYEAIKADAEVVNARQRFEAARLQAEQAVIAIDRLAAGRLPAGWRLAASLGGEPRALPPLDQLQAEAQQRNPELAVLRAEVTRREARLREARASRFPGIEVRAGQVREPEIRQQTVSATLRLPLLDQRRGPIDEAAAELERARTQLDGRRIELGQQIQSAARALDVARLRVDALARGALPDAEAALRVAQAAYRFGERGILDVLDAQRLLRSVRADLIDARFRLQAAAVELEFLAGRHAIPDSMLAPTP